MTQFYRSWLIHTGAVFCTCVIVRVMLNTLSNDTLDVIVVIAIYLALLICPGPAKRAID